MYLSLCLIETSENPLDFGHRANYVSRLGQLRTHRFLSYFPRRNISWEQEGLLCSMPQIKKAGSDKMSPINVVKLTEIRQFRNVTKSPFLLWAIFHEYGASMPYLLM